MEFYYYAVYHYTEFCYYYADEALKHYFYFIFFTEHCQRQSFCCFIAASYSILLKDPLKVNNTLLSFTAILCAAEKGT